MTKDEYSELKAKIETENENRAANTIPAKLVSKTSDGCYTFDFDDGFWGAQVEEAAVEPVVKPVLESAVEPSVVQNQVEVENEVIQARVKATLEANGPIRQDPEIVCEERPKSPVSVVSNDAEDSVPLMVLNVKQRAGKTANHSPLFSKIFSNDQSLGNANWRLGSRSSNHTWTGKIDRCLSVIKFGFRASPWAIRFQRDNI